MNDKPSSEQSTPRVEPKALEYASLAGLLKRQPTTTLPTDPAPVAVDTDQVDLPTRTPDAGQAPQQSDAPADRRRTPAPAAGERAMVGERRRMVFTLPADLRNALVEHGRHHSVTQADVIFDAIEVHLSDLPRLIRQAQPSSDSKMFQRQPRDQSGQPRVTVSVWMSAVNVGHLDALTAKFKAASRTQLLEVALRQHLTSAE